MRPCGLLCPFCIANVRGRSNYGGHAGFRPYGRPPGVIRGVWMKKPDVLDRSESSVSCATDVAFHGRYPTLWEYLTTTRWEDSSPRMTATLTVFVEDGVVKLCLADRAMSRTGWCSGKTFLEALEAVEGALRLDRMEWRRKVEQPSNASGRSGKR